MSENAINFDDESEIESEIAKLDNDVIFYNQIKNKYIAKTVLYLIISFISLVVIPFYMSVEILLDKEKLLCFEARILPLLFACVLIGAVSAAAFGASGKELMLQLSRLKSTKYYLSSLRGLSTLKSEAARDD